MVAGGLRGGAGVVTVAPLRICMVVSSRSADDRPAGRVPYHPSVFPIGRVRCNLCNADALGVNGAASTSVDERGRKEASTVRESYMP